jgi:hypothetical protein
MALVLVDLWCVSSSRPALMPKLRVFRYRAVRIWKACSIKILRAAGYGIDANIVDVGVRRCRQHVGRGPLPYDWLPDAAVRESQDRVWAAREERRLRHRSYPNHHKSDSG